MSYAHSQIWWAIACALIFCLFLIAVNLLDSPDWAIPLELMRKAQPKPPKPDHDQRLLMETLMAMYI